MDKILQIIPAPENMYVKLRNIDDDDADRYLYERAVCLALVEDENWRCVRVMTINDGNYIEIADYDNVEGIVMTNTQPASLIYG